MNYKTLDLNNPPFGNFNLIEASAGTGKTYTIAELYLWFILKSSDKESDVDIDIEKILVVTFTDAATAELKERIRKRLKDAISLLQNDNKFRDFSPLPDEMFKIYTRSEEVLNQALKFLDNSVKTFDLSSIFTIHSFCQRMLVENAFESGSLFNAEFITDESEIVKKVIEDFWRNLVFNESDVLLPHIVSNLSPKTLIEFYNKFSNYSDIKVVPGSQKFDENNFLLKSKELELKFNFLVDDWFKKNEEIKIFWKKTDESKILHQGSFKKNQINRIISNFDEYFSSGNSFGKNVDIGKLNRSYINSKVTKANKDNLKNGELVSEDTIYEKIEEFVNTREELQSEIINKIIEIKHKAKEYIEKNLVELKYEMNKRSFQDLIVDLNNALENDSNSLLANAIRKKFKVALIDEFQDTDSLQYNIFTTIFNNKESLLYIIGDPKQSIYGFRGADIFAYLNAKKPENNPNLNGYTLDTNWRSHPKLIDAVNTFFQQSQNPFVFKGADFYPVNASSSSSKVFTIDDVESPPFVIWNVGDEKLSASTSREIAANITASEIYKLLTDKKVKIGKENIKSSNIAVLVKSKKEGDLVQHKLMKYNIPSVISSTDNIMYSDEAVQFERILEAFADPMNERAVKRAISTEFFGYNGCELYELFNSDDIWEQNYLIIEKFHHLWIKEGFIKMFKNFFTELNLYEKFLKYSDGERRITNILHLSEVINKYEISNRVGVDGILNWFKNRDSIRNEGNESELRLETDEKAVKIVTIHKSKGLEYDIVFCPFFNDPAKPKNKSEFIFHDLDNENIVLDIGTDEENNIEQFKNEGLAEKMRLLYVALTRAKYRCYTLYSKNDSSLLSYALWGKIDKKSKIDIDINNKFDSKNIQVVSIPEVEFGKYSIQENNIINLSVSLLGNKNSSKTWQMMSYSYLVSGIKGEYKSAERLYIDKKNLEEMVEPKGIFAFPKGANAGNALHDILEKIDFVDYENEKNELQIKDILEKRRIDFDKHKNSVNEMIKNLMNVDLSNGDNLSFGDIDNNHRLSEMEFFFPVEKIDKDFHDCFQSDVENDYTTKFKNILDKINFSMLGGYLRGFIDLVFEKDGKYYIVDWKSNYLGSTVKFYSEENMVKSMEEHNYFLQYYIYTLALHRYLKNCLGESYNYEEHFGGVYYIFLRGIEKNSETGIFYDKPQYQVIENLDIYFKGEK